MVTSIARQSIILKCINQTSVMVGNYEFYYAAGLVKKLYGLEISSDMEPEAMSALILERADSLTPKDEKEEYLLTMLKNYEPLTDYDAQMKELFVWGEKEPELWQVTTSWHPEM